MTAPIALAVLLAVSAVSRAADGPPAPVVRVEDGRVTMKVADAPLEDLVRRLADASGAEVQGGVRAPHPVSIELDRVPLDEALHRILGDQNFMLTFREDGTLKRLVLLGGPLAPEPPTQVVRTGATTTTVASSAVPLWMQSVPLVPGSALAAHFNGAQSANLQQLLDVAVRSDDPSLRVDAIRAGVHGIENEPALREQALSSLQAADDPAFGAALQNLAHGRAREILTQVGTTTRIPELRARAFDLLREMPATPLAHQ